MIISTPNSLPRFKDLLGNGSGLGMNITYARQARPRGIAEAFIIAEKFIAKDSVCLILGDNIFYGQGLMDLLRAAVAREEGATIFGYCVKDPQRYGVIKFDRQRRVLA